MEKKEDFPVIKVGHSSLQPSRLNRRYQNRHRFVRLARVLLQAQIFIGSWTACCCLLNGRLRSCRTIAGLTQRTRRLPLVDADQSRIKILSFSKQEGYQGLFTREGRRLMRLDKEEKDIWETYDSGKMSPT